MSYTQAQLDAKFPGLKSVRLLPVRPAWAGGSWKVRFDYVQTYGESVVTVTVEGPERSSPEAAFQAALDVFRGLRESEIEAASGGWSTVPKHIETWRPAAEQDCFHG